MDLNALKWNADGLLPVVIADDRTGAVLTLAYANREALERSIAESSTYLFSRSRNALWHKGETSGNTQEVVSVAYDCDADALLYRVIPNGPACHTGADTCFHNLITRHPEVSLRQCSGQASDPEQVFGGAEHAAEGTFVEALRQLDSILEQRKSASPDSSYVAKLYEGGVDKIGKKIGEEATEVVIAAKNASREELTWESADLIFHLLVLLKRTGVSLDDVGAELLRRAK